MLQSTGSGGLGTVKMFQALRAQSTKLLSIYRTGSSWLTGPMNVNIFTIQYPVPLFSLCTKSLIAVLKDAKQLSEENRGGPFC